MSLDADLAQTQRPVSRVEVDATNRAVVALWGQIAALRDELGLAQLAEADAIAQVRLLLPEHQQRQAERFEEWARTKQRVSYPIPEFDAHAESKAARERTYAAQFDSVGNPWSSLKQLRDRNRAAVARSAHPDSAGPGGRGERLAAAAETNRRLAQQAVKAAEKAARKRRLQ